MKLILSFLLFSNVSAKSVDIDPCIITLINFQEIDYQVIHYLNKFGMYDEKSRIAAAKFMMKLKEVEPAILDEFHMAFVSMDLEEGMERLSSKKHFEILLSAAQLKKSGLEDYLAYLSKMSIESTRLTVTAHEIKQAEKVRKLGMLKYSKNFEINPEKIAEFFSLKEINNDYKHLIPMMLDFYLRERSFETNGIEEALKHLKVLSKKSLQKLEAAAKYFLNDPLNAKNPIKYLPDLILYHKIKSPNKSEMKLALIDDILKGNYTEELIDQIRAKNNMFFILIDDGDSSAWFRSQLENASPEDKKELYGFLFADHTVSKLEDDGMTLRISEKLRRRQTVAQKSLYVLMFEKKMSVKQLLDFEKYFFELYEYDVLEYLSRFFESDLSSKRQFITEFYTDLSLLNEASRAEYFAKLEQYIKNKSFTRLRKIYENSSSEPKIHAFRQEVLNF